MRTMLLAVALFVPSFAAAATLRVGDPFPSWTLVDQTGAKVSSADLAGKTYLLWFYPKAMTPGCTAEGRGLRDEKAAFAKKGVEILGVSFDEPRANQAFAAAESFPFRLLSDADRTLAVAVGAADAPTQAVARRVSYLVGPDGKVRAVYDAVTPASHARDVLGDLDRTPSGK